jgi:hypothetical protein
MIFIVIIISHLIISVETDRLFSSLLSLFSTLLVDIYIYDAVDDGDYDEKEQPLVTVVTTEDRNIVVMSSCLLKKTI